MLIDLLVQYKGIILYLFFGGLTTLINIVAYTVLDRRLSKTALDPKGVTMIANGIAWFLAVLFAYVTNKIWVFESATATTAELMLEIALFFAARVATGLVDMAIMLVGVNVMHAHKQGTKIVSNVIVVVLNYVLSLLVVFRR